MFFFSFLLHKNGHFEENKNQFSLWRIVSNRYEEKMVEKIAEEKFKFIHKKELKKIFLHLN